MLALQAANRNTAFKALKAAALPLWLCALPLLCIIHTAGTHGVPAFQQDWVWPADGSQIAAFMKSGIVAWHRDGAGNPPLYPVAWWPYVLGGALCAIAGVHYGLLIFMYFALAAGSFGISRLVMLRGDTRLGAAVSAAVFVGNPFVLNEIQAGHLQMLWSYSLLAWLAVLAMQRPTPARALGLGAIVGLCGAQQQFLIFGAFTAIIFAAASRQWNVRKVTLAATAAACVSLPQWLPILLQPKSQALNVYLPLHHWELAQSAPLAKAIRGLGYIGSYDNRLPPAIQELLWAVPLAALVAVIAPATRRRSAVPAFLVIVGTIVANGLYGFAGPMLDFAFSHVQASALFRELYDASALRAFGFALLCGTAFSVAWRARWQTLTRSATALALLAPALFIAVASSAGLPWYIMPLQVRHGVNAIAAQRGNDRFATFPLNAPLAAGHEHGGYSPLQIGIGAHPSAAESVISWPATYAVRRYARGDSTGSQPLFERSDISTLLPLDGIKSAFTETVEPSLHPLARQFADLPATTPASVFRTSRVAVEPFQVLPGTLATRYTGAASLDAIKGGRDADLMALGSAINPLKGWARTAFWPVVPDWVFAEKPGLFTLSTSLLLPIHSPALIIAADASGEIAGSGCRRLRSLDAHFALLQCAAEPVLTGKAPLIIAKIVVGGVPVQPSRMTGGEGLAQIISDNSSSLRVHINADAGSVLVLRESYEAGWSADIPGARHVTVDGYANGWILQQPIDRTISIRYAPATLILSSVALSMLMLAAAAFSLALEVRCRGRGEYGIQHSGNRGVLL